MTPLDTSPAPIEPTEAIAAGAMASPEIARAQVQAFDTVVAQRRLAYHNMLRRRGIEVPDSDFARPKSDDPAVIARYDEFQGLRHTVGSLKYYIAAGARRRERAAAAQAASAPSRSRADRIEVAETAVVEALEEASEGEGTAMPELGALLVRTVLASLAEGGAAGDDDLVRRARRAAEGLVASDGHDAVVEAWPGGESFSAADLMRLAAESASHAQALDHISAIVRSGHQAGPTKDQMFDQVMAVRHALDGLVYENDPTLPRPRG